MTDLTCNQADEAATEYALGILPAHEARAVSAHVLRCARCRQEVEEIRRIGDQLLDLVPDAEPTLGFDRRVLSTVHRQPTRRSARVHRLVAGAVAAAVIVIGAVTAAALTGHHPPVRPAEVTAVLREGSRDVGTIYVGGHPAWVSMTVDHLTLTGTVSCQLISTDGTVTDVGTFELVDGSGTWGAPDPAGATHLAAARLVGPAGNVLASASFSLGGSDDPTNGLPRPGPVG